MIAETTSNESYQREKPYLFSVAYRMTGSASDAEDLVQDAWMRYLDAGSPDVESLRAYLTTIVSRLSLDFLRSARVRREQYAGPWMPEPVLTASALDNPEAMLEQRETVSLAYLTLLEQLTPDQRIVYVLREGFGLPYSEIAEHVGKSTAACKQVFHRARQRMVDVPQPTIAPPTEHRQLAEQFFEAVQAGDVEQIAALLAEDVVMMGDSGAEPIAPQRPVAGVDKVSRGLVGMARKYSADMQRLSIAFVDVNGAPSIVIHDHGTIDRLISVDIHDGRITAVRAILDHNKLRHLDEELAARLHHVEHP